MALSTTVQLSVASVNWQDYRGKNRGLIVFYNSDPVTDIPIREIPEELDSDILPEPNYETGTYGMYGCVRIKVRQTFVKDRDRYLFFMTKYAGAKEELQGTVIVTGFYQIGWTADVKRLHIRHCADYNCLDQENCPALRAKEYHFVSLEDAFVLSQEVLDEWEYKSKITRQTRIHLTEEQTEQLLGYLRSKPNAVDTYVAETKRLQPHGADDEDEEE
jgi:hypothetical protein